MSTKVGSIDGHRDHVTHADGNLLLASRAQVTLDRLVRLNATHLYRAVQLAVPDVLRVRCHPRNAQATSANATTTADTTNQMSLERAMRLRVGLNPMVQVSPCAADVANTMVASVASMRIRSLAVVSCAVAVCVPFAAVATARNSSPIVVATTSTTTPATTTTTTLPSAVTTIPQGCPSPEQASAVFIGELESTDPVSAVFTVVQVRAGSLEGQQTGATVEVRYGSDVKYLETGKTYIVGVAPDPVSSRLSSTVRDSADLFGGAEVAGSNVQCPEFEKAARTLTIEGQAIRTGLFTQLSEQSWRLVVAVVLPPLFVVLALFAMVWFRRGVNR